uniref:Uncharacterized protein n=1 Tax=Romanomermis culicivorax TaxID=13658 RepID=A0A915IVR5_ROMCU
AIWVAFSASILAAASFLTSIFPPASAVTFVSWTIGRATAVATFSTAGAGAASSLFDTLFSLLLLFGDSSASLLFGDSSASAAEVFSSSAAKSAALSTPSEDEDDDEEHLQSISSRNVKKKSVGHDRNSKILRGGKISITTPVTSKKRPCFSAKKQGATTVDNDRLNREIKRALRSHEFDQTIYHLGKIGTKPSRPLVNLTESCMKLYPTGCFYHKNIYPDNCNRTKCNSIMMDLGLL